MRKTLKTNDPVDRFVYHAQISMLNCRKILDHLNDHYAVDPENVNWGDVGTAEHVSELLQEVCEFIGLKRRAVSMAKLKSEQAAETQKREEKKLNKVTIVGNECKTYYFDNSKNRQNLDNELINKIKDDYYKTIEGLYGLTELLSKTDISTELKLAQQAMKIMNKSNLERLWMRSR